MELGADTANRVWNMMIDLADKPAGVFVVDYRPRTYDRFN
jgi:hypothetical protein